MGIEGRENDEVVIQGCAAVDHVAARHDAFWQTVLVFPQLFAGLGVDCVDT